MQPQLGQPGRLGLGPPLVGELGEGVALPFGQGGVEEAQGDVGRPVELVGGGGQGRLEPVDVGRARIDGEAVPGGLADDAGRGRQHPPQARDVGLERRRRRLRARRHPTSRR